jgi:hypothetical protein
MASDCNEVLLAEYGEVSNTFRMLTDIRFKLLAFLPVAAAAAAAVLARGNPTVLSLAFSLFGLVVTMALATYNARNDQLYDTLIARAASIERKLGIPDGAFANRPRAWLRLGRPFSFDTKWKRCKFNLVWKVDHRTAVATVYYASVGLWLFGVLHSGVYVVWPGHLRGRAQTWADLSALSATLLVITIGAQLIKRKRERTEDLMRKRAAQAVLQAESLELPALATDTDLQESCALLVGAETADKNKIYKPSEAEIIKARADFLSGLHAGETARYVAKGPQTWAAAQVVSILTDLPPEWLYDCATNRRLPAAKE